MSFRKAFKIAEDVKSHFSEKNEVASKNLENIIDLLIEKRYGQQELSSLLPKDQKPGEIRVKQNKAAMIFCGFWNDLCSILLHIWSRFAAEVHHFGAQINNFVSFFLYGLACGNH